MPPKLRTQPEVVRDGPAFAALGLVHRVRFPASRPTGEPQTRADLDTSSSSGEPSSRAIPVPAVILLHGHGGTEDSMSIFIRALPRDWLVVAPRGIVAGGSKGFAWLQPVDIGGAAGPGAGKVGSDAERTVARPAIDFAAAVAALRRLVDGLSGIYGVDPAHIYWMGFSEGAAAAFAAAAAGLPAAGIASLVGFLPQNDDARLSQRVSDTPIFWAAGVKDPYVPINLARSDAERLQRAGADVQFHEYPVRHQVSSSGFKDLSAWWTHRLNDSNPPRPT